MKKLLHSTDYDYLVTYEKKEKEFLTWFDLEEEEQEDYIEEDVFIDNGGLTALSEIMRYPVSDSILSDYINSLGNYEGLTVIPSMCSVYEILAINKACDGYTIFSIETIEKGSSKMNKELEDNLEEGFELVANYCEKSDMTFITQNNIEAEQAFSVVGFLFGKKEISDLTDENVFIC